MATCGASAVTTPSTNVVKRVTFSQSLTSSDRKLSEAIRRSNLFSSDDATCRDLLLEPNPETIRAYKDRKIIASKATVAGNSMAAATTAATTATDKPSSTADGGEKNPSQTAVNSETKSDDHQTTTDRKCHSDYFGVKSYLHHFYEGGAVVNPDKYDEIEGGWSGVGDYRYLIRPPNHSTWRRSFWWKVAVWSGINFLVVGVLVILVGNLVPRRPVVLGTRLADLEVVDRSAVVYNYNLDMCKIVGIVLFCAGGTVVAVALLLPSFLLHFSDEIWDSAVEPPFGVARRYDSRDEEYDETRPLRKCTVDRKVPATQAITLVQPPFEVYDSPIVVGASPHPAPDTQSIAPLISGEH